MIEIGESKIKEYLLDGYVCGEKKEIIVNENITSASDCNIANMNK